MKRIDVLLGLTLLAGTAAAQEPPPEPPASTFGETVEVRVVNLEVVVTDRDGLPVTGLGAEDFRLLIEGEETPIRYFTEVRSGVAVEPEAQAEAPVTNLPELAPGEPVGTSYLVFIDDFFPIARDRDRVLAALRDDLGRLKPEDRMAIVAFDGEQLAMLSTWTSSTRDLERALRDAMARPAKGLQRAAERRSFSGRYGGLRDARTGMRSRSANRSTLDFDERYYAELLEDQVGNMVSASAAALRSFAKPPGRKVLLLLNGGWPYEIDEYVATESSRFVVDPGIQTGRKLYAPLIDTANQVGYTVFPVDVPGQAVLGIGTADVGGERALREGSGVDLQFNEFLREHNAQYALERVARETGGRALLNAQRLDALPLAEAATRTYYFLGFEPTWQSDDQRHDVRIEVRQEGLRTSARESYVDFSRQSEISAAVESALLVGGGPGIRPLELEVSQPERSSLYVMRVQVKLSLPADQVTLIPSADGRVGELELRVAAIDERGGRTDVPVIPMQVRGPATIEPGARVTYEATIELRRLRNRLTVAVYDPDAGTLWASTVEVEPKT
jgi:VWFA-related protein